MDPSSSSSSLFSCLTKRKRDPDPFDDEPSCKRPKNDVFINYSYKDIGNGFISHLRGALKHNSFVISDHILLPVGQDMCLELLKAIEESEIFVVVFSGNYASSVRCLDELVQIIDCKHKFDGRKVLPVFFKVEPSDVRSQQGPFMEAFHAHQANEDPDRVQKWKQALKEAGRLSGLTLQNGDDEAKFLLKIVRDLEKMESPQDLHVTEHPVRISGRRTDLYIKIRLQRSCSRFQIGRLICQKELISCLTRNDEFSNMSHHNDRVTQIIRLVKGKKALLVLDDVDNFEQLEALGINPTWFYNGSRIIVRTRDKRSLGNIPYTTYLTWLMNRRESLNLFTRLMFTRDDTVNTKFIEEVVNHAGGIPLVLKVWSCHFKQYEREEWPNVLETLKRIPHDDVHKQLKMSYDSLTNRAKNLFLDIACFFLASHYDYSGNNHKNLVVKVLQDENSAFFPNNEIGYLVDKCLVEIEEPYSKLWMHYAISEMGEEIVRQENEEETGKRTRLWDERDVMHVLTEFSGTEFVESICLVTPANVFLQVEAFRKMSSLRLFYVDGHGQLSWSTSSHNDQMTPLSFKKLKYMQWNWFPFKSINSLDIDNLVVLRLQDSNLEILWEGMKSLKKLRILDVSNSWYLTKTGDFYGLENLEELYLNNCINIEELHSSMVCLHRLAILDLRESIWLDNIPWETIVKLPFLRELKVGRNGPPLGIGEDSLLQFNSLNKITLVDIDIESFPNLPPNITSIEASSCRRLMYLHSKMSKIKHLTTLQCFSCSKPRSFLMKVTGLTNLSQLTMNRCSVRQVPSEIGNLVSLKNLDLSYNPFSSLPDSISNLLELVYLRIVGCSKLRLLPLLPSNLAYIEACECRSLDILPFDSTQRSYIFRNKGFKESAFCEPLVIYLDLKKKEIPALYSYRNMGHVLSFVAPMHLHKKICGIILFMKDLESSWTPATKMINKTKNTSHCLYEVEVIYPSRAVMMFYPLDDTRLMVDAGDTMALEFDIDTDFRCGLCLIYDSDVVDSKLVIQHVNDIPDDTNDDYCSFDDIGDDHGGDDDDDDNDDEEDDAFYKYHYKYHYDFDSDYDYYLDESQ